MRKGNYKSNLNPGVHGAISELLKKKKKKKPFLIPYVMFIYINSRTRFILLDTIIHLISFPAYNTILSSPSFNSEVSSRMWEVKLH